MRATNIDKHSNAGYDILNGEDRLIMANRMQKEIEPMVYQKNKETINEINNQRLRNNNKNFFTKIYSTPNVQGSYNNPYFVDKNGNNNNMNMNTRNMNNNINNINNARSQIIEQSGMRTPMVNENYNRKRINERPEEFYGNPQIRSQDQEIRYRRQMASPSKANNNYENINGRPMQSPTPLYQGQYQNQNQRYEENKNFDNGYRQEMNNNRFESPNNYQGQDQGGDNYNPVENNCLQGNNNNYDEQNPNGDPYSRPDYYMNNRNKY